MLLQSIRGRLILSLISALLFVTLTIFGFSFYQAEKLMQENRGILLNQLAQSMAYQLSKDMQNRSSEIKMLAALPMMTDSTISLGQKQAVFESIQASYPHYAWIGMTDAQGNIIAGTGNVSVGQNVAQRTWFQQGSLELHLGSVHDAFLLSELMPKPKWDDLPLRLVDISMPIKDKNGVFIGVVCAHLSWDWAYETRQKILSAQTLKNVDLLVTNADGFLLMGTETLHSASINLSSLPVFEQIRVHQTGLTIETWPDQKDYMSAAYYDDSKENERLQWVVIAKERLDFVMTPVMALQVKIFLVLALGILVLGWLIWRIVSKSTQALEALTNAANKINSGQTNITIPTYPLQDEVGVLSTSLAQLITRLQKEIAEKTDVATQLQLMAQVHDDSPQGILITDKNSVILSVNQAFVDVTGYSREECLGQTPRFLSSGRHNSHFYQKMWSSVQTYGRWQGEVWNRSKSGDIYPEWLLISALKTPEGKVSHYIGICSDITDKKEAENQLVFLANHDVLTQLPNRRLLQDVINRSICQNRHQLAGLIFLDLDFFKSINDSLGHLVGDQLLKVIADRLKQQFASPNMIARFGGDEFVIFMPSIQSQSELEVTAQQLVELFESPFVLADYSLQVGVTMGVSVYPRDGEDAHSLIQAADTAMYDIKSQHAQPYQFYSASMRESAIEKLLLERDLKQALGNNEFYLVYQPQVDLDSGCLKGMEALMRWHHPVRGGVSPVNFIPVLEEMGIIDEIGLWVVEEALTQFKEWFDTYSFQDITISINLSAIQLRNPKLSRLLTELVEQSGVPSENVIFEVTESVMIDDDIRTISELDALKKTGCQFALDDYGTGYSNLAYIAKFNLTELKIDQVFIKKIQSHEVDKLIVHHTIEMATGLGMKVVAEGVETQEQIEALKAYSNIIIQGYYFDKPLSHDVMSKRLSEERNQHWLLR